jgi:hypothetical protein
MIDGSTCQDLESRPAWDTKLLEVPRSEQHQAVHVQLLLLEERGVPSQPHFPEIPSQCAVTMLPHMLRHY